MSSQSGETIALLGMHRSGTSCVAGIMSALGFYLGSDDGLIEGDSFNNQGYFEDLSVINCNERLFSCELTSVLKQWPQLCSIVGRADFNKVEIYGWIYGAWLSLVDGTINKDDEKLLISEALKKYDTSNDNNLCRVIKDPRLSIQFARWKKHIDFKAAIIVVRNPVSVVQSIFFRDGISPGVASDMYYLYNKSALAGVEGVPYFILDYDDLLINKEKVINDLVIFLKNNGYSCGLGAYNSAVESINHRMNHVKKNLPIYIPDELKKFYEAIKIGGMIDSKESDFYNDESLRSRFVDVLLEIDGMQHRVLLDDLRVQMNRLNKHPFVGPVISALRRIKRDKTFGECL